MFQTGNLVLDSFSAPLRKDVLSMARRCQFALGTALVRRGGNPNNLVFLTSGMASLIVKMEDGGATEVGMLGRESMTGVSTLLGDELSHAECVVQIPGHGFQMPKQHLLNLFQSSSEFRERIFRIVQSQIKISVQISACNLRHHAKARFARWLLSASDRTNSDTLPMTQEFLAEMIGTRRTTVSVVVQPLRRSGLVRQSRGTIYILNRPRLLAVACECYELCRRSLSPREPDHFKTPPPAFLAEQLDRSRFVTAVKAFT